MSQDRSVDAFVTAGSTLVGNAWLYWGSATPGLSDSRSSSDPELRTLPSEYADLRASANTVILWVFELTASMRAALCVAIPQALFATFALKKSRISLDITGVFSGLESLVSIARSIARDS